MLIQASINDIFMKNLLFFLYTGMLLLPFGLLAQESIDKHATPETRELLGKIRSLVNKGIMFGHQDALAYGIGWKYPDGQSDVFRVTGDYPAVFGWDLGHLETGSTHNLDSVSFKQMKEFARTVHASGGINQYSWHCNNPLTGGSSWDHSNAGTVKSILPGGEKHLLYCSWLDQVAGFLSALRDENGQAIPVLFRPFHEFEGEWFWWGKPYCSTEEFIQLFRFTIDYLQNTKQVHNIIIVFSNADCFSNFLERYPGNSYVDMIGFDIYQSPNTSNEAFSTALKEKLQQLDEAAKITGKIPAITEIGYEQIPDPGWWTGVLWPAIQEYKLSYILLWRNAANRPNHYYMPYPGHPSVPDFLKLYQLPRTLFRKDLQ